jgi:hypothetical protein
MRAAGGGNKRGKTQKRGEAALTSFVFCVWHVYIFVRGVCFLAVNKKISLYYITLYIKETKLFCRLNLDSKLSVYIYSIYHGML